MWYDKVNQAAGFQPHLPALQIPQPDGCYCPRLCNTVAQIDIINSVTIQRSPSHTVRSSPLQLWKPVVNFSQDIRMFSSSANDQSIVQYDFHEVNYY